MKLKKIAVVVGTRPNFIELAPIIHELNRINQKVLVYDTGQHYDKEMSEIFVKQLKIPKPHCNLKSGSGSHAEQTSRILVGCEKILLKDMPDVLIVEGDTTTSFAAALAASKIKIPIVHIEAGCRIFDKNMPEEINRIIISCLSSLHYAPTNSCRKNLINEGINIKNIRLFGHPLIDAINLVKDKISKITEINGIKFYNSDYYYVTIHRDFNTDNPKILQKILQNLSKLAKQRKIIFPIHPRTKKRIEEFGLERHLDSIISLPPVDYITSLSLTKNAYGIITDSGGLIKESTIFSVPCISLRPNTEWIETLKGNANQLAFVRNNSIEVCVKRLHRNYSKITQNCKSLHSLLGKPGVSQRIVKDICNWNFKH